MIMKEIGQQDSQTHLNVTTLTDETKDGAHSKSLGQLLINVRKDFQVLFSRDALIDSATENVLAMLVEEFIEDGLESEDTINNIISKLGLTAPASTSFGLTGAGERLLRDNQGNHAYKYVAQELERNGVDAALQRINTLAQVHFS